jgi:hypothetical protein
MAIASVSSGMRIIAMSLWGITSRLKSVVGIRGMRDSKSSRFRVTGWQQMIWTETRIFFGRSTLGTLSPFSPAISRWGIMSA